MNGFRLVQQPWQPPPRADGLGPRDCKTNEENAVQGRHLSPQCDESVFTSQYRSNLQLRALARLEALEAVSEIAGRAPAEVRPYPSLVNNWMRAQLECLGRAQPELAAAIVEELAHRRSPAWPSTDDVAACARYLGEYRPPAPPPPQREPNSERYVEAAGLLIAACVKDQIPLATIDPLKPGQPAEVVRGSYGSAAFGDAVTRLIKHGFTLAFAPFGRRAIPPKIEIPGFEWRELPDGSGWQFAEVGSDGKSAKSKGGRS